MISDDLVVDRDEGLIHAVTASHGSGSDEDCVIEIARCVGDRSADVFRLKVGEIGQNFRLTRAVCEHVHHATSR
jgi:hypothetical protein